MDISQRLSYENAPNIKYEPSGPKSIELLKKQDLLETNVRTYTKIFKLAVKNAKGASIEDVDGNIYIDWFAGVAVMNMCHNRLINKGGYHYDR